MDKEILVAANRTFENKKHALRWLNTINYIDFKGLTPLEYAKTNKDGKKWVLTVLHSIEYGIPL